MKLTQEIFKVDRVDSHGDIIPKDVAEKMIEDFKEIPVKASFDAQAKTLGKATRVFMDGNRVFVEMELDGDDCWKEEDEAAIGGFTSKLDPDDTEGPFVFKDLTLTSVVPTQDKVKYPEEE